MRMILRVGMVCTALAVCSVCAANEVYWVEAHEMAPQEHFGYTATSGDLDQDGDADITLGFAEYWNVGTTENPVWQRDTEVFAGVSYCLDGAAALGDIDSDGDLDLVTGCRYEWDGKLHLYENVSTGGYPVWAEVAGSFDGVPMPPGPIEPSLADIDADGDLDLLAADTFDHIILVENVGTPAAPAWVRNDWFPDIELGVGGYASADFGDMDGDGDLDVVAVGESPPARCWENVGTPQICSFVENPAMLTGIDPMASGYGVELLDIDGDSDQDLLISGGFYVMQNLLYLNEQIVPVEPSSWTSIKALYR